MILWWNSNEGKVFWMWSHPIRHPQESWIIGSADAKLVYRDWVQVTSYSIPDVASPVGKCPEELEKFLISLAKESALDWDCERTHDYEVHRVKEMGDLWRILQDFDEESLQETGLGRHILSAALY